MITSQPAHGHFDQVNTLLQLLHKSLMRSALSTLMTTVVHTARHEMRKMQKVEVDLP